MPQFDGYYVCILNKENHHHLSDFDNNSSSDWELVAREELNGASPWEKLAYTGQGWSIKPYYAQSGNGTSPLLKPSANFYGPREWFNCPAIYVQNDTDANKTALEYLKEGADGIMFELDRDVNFQTLLSGIEWKHCSIIVRARKNAVELCHALDEYIAEKVPDSEIHGAFFGNISPQKLISQFPFSGFIFDPVSSVVDEIANGFNQIINSNPSSHVAVSTNLDNDFFLSIAKLRAIRTTWRKYCEQKGIKASEIFIHAVSPTWIDKNFQPHGNLLKGTYSAMAGILGGCHSLTVLPEDPANTTMVRAARNISNILREESHFSKVADPLAGSYFIEDLTQQLVDAVWKSINYGKA